MVTTPNRTAGRKGSFRRLPCADAEGQVEPVRVVVRLRPPELRPDLQKLEDQKDARQRVVKKIAGISADGRTLFDGTHVKWKWDPTTVTSSIAHRDDDRGTAFHFSRVYSPGDTTKQLYDEQAKPVVQQVLNGFNGCIFAYGQTNSGKTYTVSGDQLRPGVVPHACLDIFRHMKERDECVSLLRMSYLEIYNEQVNDLLADGDGNPSLQFGEDDGRGVVVKNRTEKVVSNLEEVLDYLKQGEARRAVGRNNVHEHASRSHAVFQLIFETRDFSEKSKAVRVSTLSVVDLAGSESNYNNFEQTPADYLDKVKDTQTIAAKLAYRDAADMAVVRKDREGSNIRRSLTALVRVVQTLAARPDAHIPYRDSKLTRLLSGALGGSSNTLIVCTVNPVEEKETISTLRFAVTAQRVHNRPKTVMVENDKAMLNRYEESLRDLQRNMMLQEQTSAMEVDQYRAELSKKDAEVQQREAEAKELQKRMASLSKYILTSNKLAVGSDPTLKTHYGRNPTGRHTVGSPPPRMAAPSEYASARGRTAGVDPTGKRRRHSFDYNMNRCAKSKELFGAVDSLDVTRATRVDDAFGILQLANSSAIKETHTEIVKAQIAQLKEKIAGLEGKVKRQESILSKSGREKDRAIAKAEERIAGFERQMLDLKDAHAVEKLRVEQQAAQDRLELEARKDKELSELRRTSAAELAAKDALVAELRGELATAMAERDAQAKHAASLYSLCAKLGGERAAMLKALGDKQEGGCMAPPPLPVNRWRNYVPQAAEVVKEHRELQDYAAEQERRM